MCDAYLVHDGTDVGAGNRVYHEGRSLYIWSYDGDGETGLVGARSPEFVSFVFSSFVYIANY